jgi:hypothetical protein
MPLYEEKLISPLAIRFTQHRIRETFRDGREVEATIKEIRTLPGVGDYDIILDAPFPAIEMIRWAPNGRKAGKGEEHWFSFDNRRLYCLQRLATAYWPKRVAAKVEVLYADSGTIRKKLDSQTQGLSVVIGHAFAVGDELKGWSWRKVAEMHGRAGNLTSEAEACIAADDAKTSFRDLMDVPAPGSLGMLSSVDDVHCEALAKTCFEVVSNAHELENCTSETDAQENDQAVAASETMSAESQSLTNLIGQLLKMQPEELSQACDHIGECSRSEKPDEGSAEATIPQTGAATDVETEEAAECTKMDEQECDEDVLCPETVQQGADSLTSLIGELLKLEPRESLQDPPACAGDGAKSSGSDTGALASTATGSLSRESSPETSPAVSNASDEDTKDQEPPAKDTSEEDTKDQEPSAKDTSEEDTKDQVPPIKEDDSSSVKEVPSAKSSDSDVLSVADEETKKNALMTGSEGTLLKKACAGMKTAKEPHMAKVAQRTRSVHAAQAAQLQMAQWQMAQWQMAQWQMECAQMAQWQQSSYAMAQFQAGHDTYW